MTGGHSLVIEAPAECPDCGSSNICFEYALGDSFGAFHCGDDHHGRNGICGWRGDTQFVGIGEPFIVVTTYDVDLETDT
jgi:hypothetical protein